MSGRVPNVLSIAGSDPSGGAGIQADLKTFAALGVYGCAVPTALTAQNTVEVRAVFPVPRDFIEAQLEAVFSDVRVDAVKIGMLGTVDTVLAVAAALRDYRPSIVVLDPVLRASTGAGLVDAATFAALSELLLPLATIVTPNAPEAAALLGIDAAQCPGGAREAAASLRARGARAVVVTGGHLADADVAVDVFDAGEGALEITVPRIAGGGGHGTGCTYSSAVAALLARGLGLPEACTEAQRFVAAAIAHGAALRVGRGAGPVHQLGELWMQAGRGVA